MTIHAKRRLALDVARFALKNPFVISRGAKTEAATVVVTIEDRGFFGRGECTPYGRYGESLDSVCAQIELLREKIEAGLDRHQLQAEMAPGAARNALDCALWDLDAKITRIPAYRLANIDRLSPCVTAFTLSLDAPEAMARAAIEAAERPLLKLKLGGAGDPQRIFAVREAAPEAELIVDANEAWTPDNLDENFAACARAGVALVEQPLPAADDAALAQKTWPVPVCADESVFDRAGLAALRTKYQLINVKLDKTGGLTEALALVEEAERQGFGVFVGCMVASSLAMAPALLLAGRARFVDLDGPLLLAQDRDHGLRYDGSLVFPPEAALWG